MTKKRQGSGAAALQGIVLGPHRQKFVPPADEHAGKGGSYVLDPATGKRELRERTRERDEVDAEPAADPADDNREQGE